MIQEPTDAELAECRDLTSLLHQTIRLAHRRNYCVRAIPTGHPNPPPSFEIADLTVWPHEPLPDPDTGARKTPPHVECD